MTTPTGQPEAEPSTTPVNAKPAAGPTPTPTPTQTTQDMLSSLPAAQSNRLFDIANLKDDGSNFPMWKFRLQMILQMRKLWGIVSKTEWCPNVSDTAAVYSWMERDHLAKLQISLTLDDAPLSSIMLAKTSSMGQAPVEV